VVASYFTHGLYAYSFKYISLKKQKLGDPVYTNLATSIYLFVIFSQVVSFPISFAGQEDHLPETSENPHLGNLNILPNEVIFSVMNELDPRSLLTLSQVSTFFRDAINGTNALQENIQSGFVFELEKIVEVLSPKHSVSFSADGKTALLASGGPKIGIPISVFDTNLLRSTYEIDDYRDGILSVSLSPSGNRFATGYYDGEIQLSDSNRPISRRSRGLQDAESMAHSLSFSGTGHQLVSGHDDSSVKIWDSETKTQILAVKVVEAKQESHHLKSDRVLPIRSVAFSPDASQIAAGSVGGTLTILDAATGHILKSIQAHRGTISSVMFFPDGSNKVVSGSYDGTVKVWDSSTGELIQTFESPLESYIHSVALILDGKRLVTGDSVGILRIWNIKTGKLLQTLPQCSLNPILGVSYSKELKKLVSISALEVTVWKLRLPALSHSVCTPSQTRPELPQSDGNTCILF
jgi:WD40 repeat protein